MTLANASVRRSHQADINGVRYQYPVCAICHRDVEAFTWSDHPSHATGEPMRTFFVMCHGQVQAVPMLIAELRIKASDFRIETAFAPKPLPSADSPASELPALPE